MKLNTSVKVGVFTAASIFATTLQAAPTVSGNVINLPDDGWYQIQSTDDYTSICQGGRQCEVEEGSYIVINHTTGERFNVTVEDEPSEPSGVSEVSVFGNTISWPDDGWYQVQRSEDYSTVCQGGLSCEVEPGTYTIINHTTGRRFSGIVVSGENESVSETLGFDEQRSKGVGSINVESNTGIEAFLYSVLSNRSPLTPYFTESMAHHISRIVKQASNVQQSQEVVEEFSSGWPLERWTTHAVYDCDTGGTMAFESVFEIEIGDPQSDFEYDDYTKRFEKGVKLSFDFRNCQSLYVLDEIYDPNTPADVFPYGNYVLNGQFDVDLDLPNFPGKYLSKTAVHNWNNLSVIAESPSQWSLTVDGGARYNFYTTINGAFTDHSGNYRYVYTGESGDIKEQLTASMPLE